ncbi:testis-expressed protein 47 isoform X1 [Lampetra fluviatilis]
MAAEEVAVVREGEPRAATLLTVLQERLRPLNQKSLLHRLIYVGQLHSDLADKRELAEYYERLFARLHKHHQGEAAYGLLLIYPTAVIHTVECGSESIYAILRDLRDMEQREERALLQGVKIVVVSHDLPNRLFQQWFWQVLNLPATRLEGDGGATESTVNLASEAITHVLKLGLHLLHSPKVSMRQALESVRERHPDLLLPQDTLAHLLCCHGLLTPAEFLTAYDRPFHLTLDSAAQGTQPVRMSTRKGPLDFSSGSRFLFKRIEVAYRGAAHSPADPAPSLESWCGRRHRA